MRTDAIPLAGGAYTDESKPFSMQDTLNLRAQRTEAGGTRAPDKLQTLPGLRPFVEVAGLDGVRGAHNAEGRLLAVMGRTLYRISAAGVAIPLGTVPGMGRVQIDHNQISLGNEVLAVNGSAGYLWNSVTNAFSRVSDPGFPGGSVVKFINGYFVVIEPQGRFAQSSAPAQGLQWNTLDRFTSEVSPDRLMSAGVRGSELLLLSASSGEFFQATANAQQPFRTKRIDFKVGAAGPHATIDADNNIWWLGSDGVFYCLNGYSQFRISTRPIENAIRGLDWSRAFVKRWDTVLYWTFPDGRTWGFDFAEKEWHRRESYGLNRWRVNTMTWWNERWIAGDSQAGRLWDCNLSDRYYLEGDTPYVVRRTLGVSHDNQNPVRCPRLELVMDTGQALTEAVGFPVQPEPPTITGDAPNGVIGTAYSYSYTVGDGTPPYAVTLRSGALPTGITLSAAGGLSGTPTAAGDYAWTLRVTDATGLWAEIEDTNVVTAVTLVTDKDYYTGPLADLVASGSSFWPVSAVARSLSTTRDGIWSAAGRGDAPFLMARVFTSAGVVNATIDTPPDGVVFGTAFTEDGRFLAVRHSGTGGVAVYSVSGTALTKMADPGTMPGSVSGRCKFSVDQTKLAITLATTSAPSYGVMVYDFNDVTGALTNAVYAGAAYNALQPEYLDWRPGDNTYLLCGHGSGVYVLDTTEDPMGFAGTGSGIGTGLAGAGCYWDATGDNVFTVSLAAIVGNYILKRTFTDTPGSEALGAASATTGQPAAAGVNSAITPDRATLVVTISTTTPSLFDVATSGVFDVTVSAEQPPAASATVSDVAWADT